MTRQYAKTQSVATDAKNYVAAPSGAQSTDDTEIGTQPDRLMKSSGDASESLDRAGANFARVSDSPMDADWIADMAFMAEMVDIMVPETDDPQAEHIFEININGRAFFFRRGENKTVPRYVADHMLRMKRTIYVQKEASNNEGVKDILHQARTSLKYPFMLVRDASPNSQAWFKFTSALRG